MAYRIYLRDPCGEAGDLNDFAENCEADTGQKVSFGVDEKGIYMEVPTQIWATMAMLTFKQPI
jgi:hypothetical protein